MVKQKRKRTALPGQMPDVGKIMDFEAGEMDQEETIRFFQELIDSGAAWWLQGSYGRMAARLIDAGYCEPAPD